MAKFLVAFYGGKMAATPAEQKKSMDDWTKWFTGLGKSVADQGGPTMPGKTVTSAGVKAGPVGEAIAGYSILVAADVDAGMKAAVYPLADMMAPPAKK